MDVMGVDASVSATPATPPPAAHANSAQFVDLSDPDLTEAIRRYRDSGNAPVLRHPGFVRFPYGEGQPILTCKPLRVCDVQLEAGESVLDVALGDSEQWIVSQVESGPPTARIEHILVKPADYDVTTNLVITTDRRVYHLGLISTADESSWYFRSVRFYYPQELVQRWEHASTAERVDAAAASERVAARLPAVDPEALHFAYRIRGDRVPWKPVQAFDDRTCVFIQMPDTMHSSEAPALFVQSESGEHDLVNYRVRGSYYVVDRLFDKAALVLGVGRTQKRVTVTRLP